MVTVAGGMESDFSDTEDMFFSYDDIKKNKNEISSAIKDTEGTPNGLSSNQIRNEPQVQQQRPTYNNESRVQQERPTYNNRYNNSRGFTKYRPHNRNRYQQMQNRNTSQSRQCLDYQSNLILDDLRYAVLQGNLEATKNIISKGICVDAILKAGWTGLMYACSSGQAEIVSYLLEQNADPNYHKDMFTPLMAVCASKKSEVDLMKCCSLLLQHDVKVDAHERHYTTPLMFAAREGYALICKELLDHKADPNLKDNRGKTALAWAAFYGHGQIVRLLMENGADVNIINDMGQSAVDLAYENGHTEVASLLQNGHFLKQNSGTESCTDLVAKKESDLVVKEMSNQGNSKNYAKVGELDLFLSGVGFPELIPTFLEHKLEFCDLLIMDDAELETIGITQVGIRKKILEACNSVHKKEWKGSSLPNLKQKHFISCPDAVAMMANIAKHLKYISTSVIYIRQQIQSQPRILELSQDAANVHDLLDEMDDSLKNVRYLNDELRFLKMHLEKVQDKVQCIPADLIVQTIPTNQGQNRVIYIAIGVTVFSATVAGILWKSHNILDLIPSYIRIKIPYLS
ncbi:ankyrin repeat, SAM and basic leucine zipper domain-containing protein 1 [Caerostris darwini]|uniref:Ankyrin repeat, SAM and basic leucine zipper domain-containing protein 1 n=1 Tax=Caerostris darwini TaxID=1538125 RepID=A0AAV4WIZ9_9ARAC|nr:ankyrin repeat, SAM and basic leucine zipper domain-containing protein 1 [Caerostris darwini]